MRPAFRVFPFVVLLCCSSGTGRAQVHPVGLALPDAPDAEPTEAQSNQQAPGTLSGTVVDGSGSAIAAALVTLTVAGQPSHQVATDSQGVFLFSGVTPGAFGILVNALGFGTRGTNGLLHAGEVLRVPDVALAPMSAATDVQVTVTRAQLAEEQIHVEEKQRVFGVLANFYVTYDPHPLAMSPRQKFQMAWKTAYDPIGLLITGVVAGVQQANDSYSGYGQGAQGYAKRYGANYADGFIGDMIGNAILPVVFKQDPRYFYKGTGTVRSRTLYAIANAVVRKGDNGKWQPDYSGILGGLAAGGISNLYYPAANRDGVGLTFENTFIGVGTTAIGNLFQEFLIRRLTPGTRIVGQQP